MTITLKQGIPKELAKEVTSIVNDCFDGVWSSEDLQQLVEIPHESQLFIVAYDGSNPIGYAYIVADYVESVDFKIATIQELGMLPDYRESDVAGLLIEDAIKFSQSCKAELVEQVVSSLDQWIIPTLISKNLKPSEIKADREISTFNEAKLILNSLRKNPKLNVIMNQLFFETNNDLETHLVDNESDFADIPRNDPIAFGSIISVDKSDELDSTLNELKKINVEWDEIGITFDYKI
ncbi:MAG: GNAT family N-acetyltransferase [Candidatus Thorarchaeota archaeon]